MASSTGRVSVGSHRSELYHHHEILCKSPLPLYTPHNILLKVVASALVAAAMAEADPALFYAGYGYPYAYGLHAFAGKSAPCVNAANEPVPCAGAPLAYAGYPYVSFSQYRELVKPHQQ